jgi:methanogenic corrinoid protein MtbC1
MADLKKITELIGNLEEEEVLDILNEFVASNPSEEDAQKVVSACQEGMAVVGELFESGEYFVGDLIFAGELLSEAIDALKPVIGSGSSALCVSIVVR